MLKYIILKNIMCGPGNSGGGVLLESLANIIRIFYFQEGDLI